MPGSPQPRVLPSAAAPHLPIPHLSQPSTQSRSPAEPLRSPSASPLSSPAALDPTALQPNIPLCPITSCLPSSVSRQSHSQARRQTCIQMSISVVLQTRSLAPSPTFPNARISASPHPCSPGALQHLPPVPTAHHTAPYPRCKAAPELLSSMCRQPQSQQLGPSSSASQPRAHSKRSWHRAAAPGSRLYCGSCPQAQ